MGGRDNGSSRRRPGRPVKDRAETKEARKLAEYLQRVTEGMTVKSLSVVVGIYGHAKWAEFRNGADVIPMHVLERLLDKVVPDPRARERLLAEGRELVERAERAAAGKLAASTRGLTKKVLLQRLGEAQDAQRELRDQLVKTNVLVMLLLNVLHNIRQHNEALRAEAAHQRLQAARLRSELAEQRLRSAKAARHEAEDLHVESYAQVDQYRRLLNEPRAALELPAIPATWEYHYLSEQDCDRQLDEVAAILLQVWQTLHAIRDRLGLPPADDGQGPRIVRGELVDNQEPQVKASLQSGCGGEPDEPHEQEPRTAEPEPDASESPPPDICARGSREAAAERYTKTAEEREDAQPSHRAPTGVLSSLPRRRVLVSLAMTAPALLSAGDGSVHRVPPSARPLLRPSAPRSPIAFTPLVSGEGNPDNLHDKVDVLAVGAWDGRTIAVTSASDVLRVWDLATGRLVGKPLFGGTWTANLALAVGSLNGRPIVVTGGENAVAVLDLTTGQGLGELRSPHPAPVIRVAVGPLGGRTVAVSVDEGGDLRMWDPATGELVRDPHTEPDYHYFPGKGKVAVGTLRGRIIAVYPCYPGVRVWDMTTNELVAENRRLPAEAVAVSGKNAIAVSVGADESHIWDLISGKELGAFPHRAPLGDIAGVAVGTLRGRAIVVACYADDIEPDDKVVHAWDLSTRQVAGKPIRCKEAHGGFAVCTVKGKTVAVVGKENTVRVCRLGPS